MQHPDEGTIHAWLDGALDADDGRQLEEHAATCAECTAAIAAARALIAGASRVVSQLDGQRGRVMPVVTPAVAHRGSLWRLARLTPLRAALAASLMIGTATVVAVRHAVPTRVIRDSALTITLAESKTTRAATPAVGSAVTPAVTPPQTVATQAAPMPAAPKSAAAAVAADTRDEPQRVADTRLNAMERSAARASLMAAPRADVFAGCYRVEGDSAIWPAALPTRFALVAGDTSDHGIPNQLRRLTADGHIDSVVPGVTWSRRTAQLAALTFTENGVRQAMLLEALDNGSFTATLRTPPGDARQLAAPPPIELTATVCRR